MSPTFRVATLADTEALAEMNHALIRDEGHHNRMTVPELRTRMEGFLAGEYRATVFEVGAQTTGYALYR